MRTFKCLALLLGVFLASASSRSVRKNDDGEIGNVHVAPVSKSDNGRVIDHFKVLSKQRVGEIRDVIQKGVEGLRGDLEEFMAKNGFEKTDGLKWRAFNATIEKRLGVLKQSDENWKDFMSDFRAAYKEFIQDVSFPGDVKKENVAQSFLEKGFISIVNEIEKSLYATDGSLKTFFSFLNREATTEAANASTPGIFVGIGLTVNQILRPNENGNVQYEIATTNNQTANGGILQHFGQAVNQILRPANGIQNDTNVPQNNGGQNGIQTPAPGSGVFQAFGQAVNNILRPGNGSRVNSTLVQNNNGIQAQAPGSGVLQAFGHAVNNILRPSGNVSRVNSTLIQNESIIINNQTQIPNAPNVGVFQAFGQAVSNIFRPPGAGNLAQQSQNDTTQNTADVQKDTPSTTTRKPNRRRKPKPPQQDVESSTEKPYVIQILNVYTDPSTAQNIIRPQSDEYQNQNKTQSLNVILHLVYDKSNNKSQEDSNVSLSSSPQGSSDEDVIANVNTNPGEPVNIYLDFGSILSEFQRKNSSGNKAAQIPDEKPSVQNVNKPSVQNNDTPSNQNVKKPDVSQGVAQNVNPQGNPEAVLQNYSFQQPNESNGSNSSLHILVIQTPKQN